MTSNNIVNAIIVLELDNGEYAITRTTSQNVIRTCCEFLQFKRMPKKYFENYSLAELDIEGGEE